ncbi:MAG TPA: CBS domain-containing protein [Nitrospinae bacterium]|nr:CBS domain-containing protein [Nitrospinota bacterium]
MTTGVVTISLDEKLDLVDEIMSSGDIRHMPVTKGGFVVGLVTQRDLLRAKLSSVINFSKEDRKELLEATDVEKVMVKDVKLADPNEPVVHAAKRMLEMRIGCLPVVNNDRELLGIITEIDVMRYFVEIAEGNDS